MNKAYAAVKKFHEACSIEMPDKPTLLSGAGVNEYHINKLEKICSEMKEDSSMVSDRYGETNNRASYMLEELVEFMQADTLEDQADSLTDLIYFAIGTFTLMGVQPQAIFDIVQRANMGKVGPDGKVIRDDQGKIRKPEGWTSPEPQIVREIERQAAEGQDYQYPRVWKD